MRVAVESAIGGTPIARQLYAGRYADILAATIDGEAAGCEPDDVAFVVGALSFVGRLEEAELLLENHRRAGDLAPRSLCAAGFFMTVALSRSGDFERARATLRRATAETGGRRDSWSRSFLLQGAAACHFFSARYRRAARAALGAQGAAQRARFAYVQMLATDMRAHVGLQRGELDEGLRLLEQARTHARHLGLDVNAQVIEVSIALERGVVAHPARAIASLEALVEAADIQDGYSRRLLLSQLSRCYALVGRGEEARRAVDEAARLSTRDGRARLAIACTRAEVHRVLGGWPAAEPFIEEARALAGERADPSWETEIAGLELGRATWLSLPAERAAAQAALERLFAEHQLYRAASWLYQHGARESAAAVDEYARILRPVVASARFGRESREAIQALLRTGLWGLTAEACGLVPGRRVHLFDDAEVLERDGDVRRLERLPPRGRAILVALSRRPLSREGLLRAAWNVNPYRPHRHDAVIKTTISRLRDALGRDVLWLETVEGGYRLADGVEVVVHGFELSARPGSLEEVAALAESTPPAQRSAAGSAASAAPDLKAARWARIARALAGAEPIAAGELARDLRVPVRTVSRDLGEMFAQGLLERSGEGRSTRYRAPRKAPRKETPR